jgi:adenylate cyclase class 2
MLEVEMKFPVADFAPLRQQLADWGAVAKETRSDSDCYYNAPDRDFAKTDEALRVRSIGCRNFVTYKGPKRDKQTKTRTELEVPLGDGSETARQFGQILQHLGYRFVAQVRKQRTIYDLDRDGFHLEICLDNVGEVGQFAELEIIAPEEQIEPAKAVLRDVAAGLKLTTSERRSYLEMLLEGRSA